MAKPNLTAARLRELLHYDPETDTWTRLESKYRPDIARKPLRAINDQGYFCTVVNGSDYLLHRLVWLWHHGQFPSMHLDHINGNRKDNRIENLREAYRSTNAQNQRKPHKNNSVGFLGVWKLNGRFGARINVWGGERIYLGCFDTPEEAHEMYVRAKRILHPGNTL